MIHLEDAIYNLIFVATDKHSQPYHRREAWGVSTIKQNILHVDLFVLSM